MAKQRSVYFILQGFRLGNNFADNYYEMRNIGDQQPMTKCRQAKEKTPPEAAAPSSISFAVYPLTLRIPDYFDSICVSDKAEDSSLRVANDHLKRKPAWKISRANTAMAHILPDSMISTYFSIRRSTSTYTLSNMIKATWLCMIGFLHPPATSAIR